MADWTITPELVKAPDGAPRLTKLAASNIGPGNAVWEINTNYVALANATNVNAARLAGITVDFAYTGQPITYVAAGTMGHFGNAALATAHAVVLSPNAGLFCNHADLTTNHYVSKLGWANNASTVALSIEVTGLQRA